MNKEDKFMKIYVKGSEIQSSTFCYYLEVKDIKESITYKDLGEVDYKNSGEDYTLLEGVIPLPEQLRYLVENKENHSAVLRVRGHGFTPVEVELRSGFWRRVFVEDKVKLVIMETDRQNLDYETKKDCERTIMYKSGSILGWYKRLFL